MKIIDRKFLSSKTRSCHASTISFYQDKPVFAWFGGQREGLPDSSIYVEYNGQVQTLGANINVAYWNPILFTVENKLFLAYKMGEFCDRWTTYIRNISEIGTTNGLNKYKSKIIPAGLNFCVKTKPIVDGKYIHCGSSVETVEDWTSYIEVYEYKDGEFEFCHRSQPLTIDKKLGTYVHPYFGKQTKMSQGIIQPSLWKEEDGSWNAFFRSSRGVGKIYHSKGKCLYGEGELWAVEWLRPTPTEFDNPNASVDTVYFDGRLFLVYNPSEEYRHPLWVVELDKEFNAVDMVKINESVRENHTTHTSELSYPYMIEYGGELHLTYTYGRSRIEYVTIGV